MKRLFVILLFLTLPNLGCADSWNGRQRLHSEYISSVKENGVEASSDLKAKLEEYDAIYREFSYEMINKESLVDHKKAEYSKICNLDCGPFVFVLESYFQYRKTGSVKYIENIIENKNTQEAFIVADGIIRPDLISQEKRLKFFPDHGLVRSVLYLLNEDSKKGNGDARELLVKIAALSDGENKSLARDYLDS